MSHSPSTTLVLDTERNNEPLPARLERDARIVALTEVLQDQVKHHELLHLRWGGRLGACIGTDEAARLLADTKVAS